MAGIAKQLPSLLGFLLRRGDRNRNDTSTAREFNWDGGSAALPNGVELQWLGTSGFRIAHEGHTILIDPYLTRIPLGDVLRRRSAQPNFRAIDKHVSGAVAAVLIGHTHFDHALDAPVIARRSGCPVYGSRSMANLMRLYGLEEHAIEVELYKTYEVGPFAVTFVPSVHSKLLLGLKVPFEGDISCEHFDDLVTSAYGCGQVYGIHIEVAGTTFYHQGSADLIEDAIRHRGVDYFLVGIAGRGFTKAYTERILRCLEPKVVVPHHFDDFFKPLEAPLGFSFNVNLSGFIDEVRSVSNDFEIRSLDLLQTVGG